MREAHSLAPFVFLGTSEVGIIISPVVQMGKLSLGKVKPEVTQLVGIELDLHPDVMVSLPAQSPPSAPEMDGSHTITAPLRQDTESSHARAGQVTETSKMCEMFGCGSSFGKPA